MTAKLIAEMENLSITDIMLSILGCLFDNKLCLKAEILASAADAQLQE